MSTNIAAGFKLFIENILLRFAMKKKKKTIESINSLHFFPSHKPEITRLHKQLIKYTSEMRRQNTNKTTGKKKKSERERWKKKERKNTHT